MRFVGALLISLAIAAAPFSWRYAQILIPAPQDMSASDAATAMTDAGQTALRDEVAFLADQLDRLTQRVDALDSRTSLNLAGGGRSVEPQADAPEASDSLKDAFAQVVLIADRRSANDGLRHATPSFLRELLGLPRPDLTDDCQPATNPRLLELLSTEDVGPIRATLVRPAMISIRQVFANVQVFEPELYDRIKTAGSLCVRRVRGAEDSASAHAYGLAVDINIDGVLDSLADGNTQLGLILLADFFRKEGWIWGAGFGREDSMHFEVSRDKLEQWRQLGEI
ncbi:M15 family metallopeptidase [Sulfitobacter sp. LCG007]